MALRDCLECGEKVSEKAAACPKCGHPLPKRAGCLGYVVGGFVLLVVIMLVVGQKIESTPPTPAQAQAASELDRRKSAVSACRTAIRRSLKDPDSADFKQIMEDTPFAATPTGYTIFPKVRATNSFGAHILSTFVCKVSGGPNWRVDSLTEL